MGGIEIRLLVVVVGEAVHLFYLRFSLCLSFARGRSIVCARRLPRLFNVC